MSDQSRPGIIFQVETSRILEILASEIYDSPHALLRENVQNAYDAVLMRVESSNFDLSDARIDLTLVPSRLTVRDNGIGMDEDVLRNHFWKAGSSGKCTEAARRAGVVGTFGIGAMANFGVAEEIVVKSRLPDQPTVLETSALRTELSIQEECIRLREINDDGFGPGTLVSVTLDKENQLNVSAAIKYLQSYIRFLPVAVYCNGEIISQQKWDQPEGFDLRTTTNLGSRNIETGSFSATIDTTAHAAGTRVLVRVSNLVHQGQAGGTGILRQDAPPLMGLRNHFGLAPIPVSGRYNFGGFINASFLQPTAGREALSRESIQIISVVVGEIEKCVSDLIAGTPIADQNTAFQQLALSGPAEMGRNVTVRLAPSDDRIKLEQLQGRKILYFQGSDLSTIKMFASDECPLVVVAQSNPRRALQLRYITNVLSLDQVPDRPTILKMFEGSDLSYAEASFLLRATSLLIEEYLISDIEVGLAEISHGVQILVETPGNPAVRVILSRSHPHLGAVLEACSAATDTFAAFVRDFVRMDVYDKISKHVPSATRQGAEALIAQIRHTRELYQYDEDELGSFEPLLSDLLSGAATVGEVLRRAGRRVRPQAQHVTLDQVGTVETELPGVIHDRIAVPGSLEAAPPILRSEIDISMKILTSESSHSSLNGFLMLLGLSEKLSNRERPFFEAPHQTRVMWAQHRIVYVFTHASGELSLYYDIEMTEPISASSQGGLQLPTTTVITKRRIFVPVPDELRPSFELVDGERKFHVRFDTVTR